MRKVHVINSRILKEVGCFKSSSICAEYLWEKKICEQTCKVQETNDYVDRLSY